MSGSEAEALGGAPAPVGPGEWDMQVVWLDPDDLVPNLENPNEEDDATFNALVAAIDQDGWTVPVQAVLRGDGRYEIVAGEHRWRAGRVLGSKIPTIVLPSEQFDADRRDMVLVKDNILRGKLNPEKFTRLYDRLARRYDAEVLQSLMGFTSQDAFDRMYREARAALPPDLQTALDAAKEEIKTIDDLSMVLNRLFREYGETLPSNFMVFSFGSKEVLWVRADRDLWRLVSGLAKDAEEQRFDLAARLLDLLTPAGVHRAE